MRKQIKKILILIAALLLFCTLTGCGSEVVVNVENTENINGANFGTKSLIGIGNGLYYDSTTRIVYWWNGWLHAVNYATTPSAYYAPNGLPYKYNPETNTFVEIEVNVNE